MGYAYYLQSFKWTDPNSNEAVYIDFFIKSNEAWKYLSGTEKTASLISFIQQGWFLPYRKSKEPKYKTKVELTNIRPSWFLTGYELQNLHEKKMSTCLHRNQREDISCLVKLNSYRLANAEVISVRIGSCSLLKEGSSFFLKPCTHKIQFK